MTAAALAGKRVAIYARFSSANQRDASIEDQVRRCRAEIERLGGAFDPSLVFEDRAVSGASLARGGLDALLQGALTQPRRIDVIVTEDVGRLSRDLADATALLKRLSYAEVPVLGVADGINTAGPGAKVAYTFRALVGDLYLDDLRFKTLRGLEGQALKGRSTGGLPFGYRSRPILDARRQVEGHEIIIDDTQADIVRRIFRECRAGHSQATIARGLNADGVDVPRAKTRHRKVGWIASTVREMLHNEAYVGRWSFKRKQWRKDPETGRRRYRKRDASEVLRHERPHLRIIDAELWDAVQARLAAVRAKYKGSNGSTNAPGRRTAYPFSGLLRCGACGAPMVIAGGSPTRYYRCSDAQKRGTCANRLAVREDIVTRRMLEALRDRVGGPWALAFIRKRVAELLGEGSRTLNAELKARRDRLARSEASIRELISMMIEGDRSPRVRQMRDDLEAHADAEKRAIEGLVASAQEPIRLPSPAEVEARLVDLERLVTASPTEAREALRQLFSDGAIRLDPQADATYIARTEILPLVLLGPGSAKPRSGIQAGPPYTSLGCAGRI